MRGIIYTEFLEFAEQLFGIVAVEKAITTADLPSGGAYSSVGNYPYAELETLLGVIAEQQSIEDIPGALQAFGNWLAGRFKVQYASFFEGHDDAISFLSSIDNHIHVEVRKLYPDAVPPRVEILPSGPDKVQLSYQSHRPLAHVAIGLTQGSLQAFGGVWEIADQTMDCNQQQMTLILQRRHL